MCGSADPTRSSSCSAGRTMSGSISSTYESNANPIAAVMQMAHWTGVSRAAALVSVVVIDCSVAFRSAHVAHSLSLVRVVAMLRCTVGRAFEVGGPVALHEKPHEDGRADG